MSQVFPTVLLGIKTRNTCDGSRKCFAPVFLAAFVFMHGGRSFSCDHKLTLKLILVELANLFLGVIMAQSEGLGL